jgi:hypothetical protein
VNLQHPVMRALVIVVFAVVLGPLIAGVSVFLFSLMATGSYAHPVWSELASRLGVMVGSAYLLGWPIALTAGVLVAMWNRSRPVTFGVVLGATALADVIFTAMAVVSGAPLALSNFFFVLVAALWAATVCWYLAGRLLERPA